MRKITQSDIARELGVSVSTVALVIGNSSSENRHHVNKETARRVREKAEELGYRPNLGARRLRKGKSNLILFLNMGGPSELGGRRAWEIGRLVHEAGYEYLSVDACGWGEETGSLLERVASLDPEGVITSGFPYRLGMNIQDFRRQRVPLVFIDQEVEDFSYVKHDVREALYELTLACIAAGRKRPGLLLKRNIAGLVSWQTRDRKRGYEEALREAGLPEPGEVDLLVTPAENIRRQECPMIFWDQYASSDTTPFLPGRRSAAKIGRSVDSLLCSNDIYALGALTHYLQEGAKIPEEMALSGFDNLAHTSEGGVPITTVEIPTGQMCQAAVELLFNEIRDKEAAPQKLSFPCKILWRKSMPAARGLSLSGERSPKDLDCVENRERDPQFCPN